MKCTVLYLSVKYFYSVKQDTLSKIINVQLKKMCFIDAKIFKKYET
jgi:hypothetical protein